MDLLNAFIALLNYVVIPATTYGSQLAFGALGVTLIYGTLRYWQHANNLLKFVLLGIALTILILVGYKKLK